MENAITRDDRYAMAEVDYVIHHMNERYLSKIPQNVKDFIYVIKNKTAKIYVDPHMPLEKQGLKEFTLYFLMILNLKYWCDDARRRDILVMLENNQKKYDDKVNNIFQNAESIEAHNDTEEASRPLNRPKKVVIAETSKTEEKIENVEKMQQSAKIVKTETTNALDDLEKETSAITTMKEENFFTKLISKIKSLLIKKK